jgi:bifunctional DNA-binding transcriptional regulator/antitoxin component of YhaV-PrlF toxin-antitoxin module
MKTYQARLSRFNSDLWHFHIPVPDEAVTPFKDMKAKRVICTLNGTERFHCALMPDGNGGYFINLNKELRTKLDLEIGDEVSFYLEKDESKYGLPMPEEMEELLRQDEEFDRFFHALTPGKQRTLIFMAGKPKTSDTRLRKALAIMGHLKEMNGGLDFKKLNEHMKRRK